MNKQKNELIIALKQLVNNLEEVAALFRVYDDPAYHMPAGQLLGSAHVIKDWIQQVEFGDKK